MARKDRLKEIEKEQGPLETVIPPLVNRLGTQKAAADSLGVSQSSISLWLKINGYRPIIQYVKHSGETA